MASRVARELFVVGLRNAHAMETQARELLERQSGRVAEFPAAEARVRQHLGETRYSLSVSRRGKHLDAEGYGAFGIGEPDCDGPRNRWR